MRERGRKGLGSPIQPNIRELPSNRLVGVDELPQLDGVRCLDYSWCWFYDTNGAKVRKPADVKWIAVCCTFFSTTKIVVRVIPSLYCRCLLNVKCPARTLYPGTILQNPKYPKHSTADNITLIAFFWFYEGKIDDSKPTHHK